MAREEAEIKELTKKLEQNPDSMVFVQLADAYRRSGDMDKCVEICLQGLERHPTYTTARTILGRAYLDMGKLDEAAGEFKKIEVSDPENIVAQRMLGQIYMDKGQYADAITRHQKVLSLDPDDTAAQEHLQEALTRAKQAPDAKPQAVEPKAPAAASQQKAQLSNEQLGTLKVAEIYIKKGALDEAVEVLSEILASDPENALARQKLKEVEEKRKGKTGNAEAEEAAKQKALEDAKQKAAEEAKRKAEAEAKQKSDSEAEGKRKEEDARKKAAEEAKRKVEEEIKAKSEALKKKAEEDAKAKAEAEAKKQAEEDAKKKSKLSSDDILSVMKAGDDELIGDSAPEAAKAASKKDEAAVDPKLKEHIATFVKSNGIEANLLISTEGKLLDSAMPAGSDASALATTAANIFTNTEKAAQRMRFGALQQVIVTSDDGRQIIFVQLKSAVAVAVTGKNTNLGMLRIAINDLMKKA